MSKHSITVFEKLEEVERLVRNIRVRARPFSDAERRRFDVLKAVCADLRGRIHGAPSAALHDVQGRIDVAINTKTVLGYNDHALRQLGEGVLTRWPTIRQALELFGALVDSGKPPLEEAFRLGFEHALAGGDEAAKKCGIPRQSLPLVMYFETEEDRREMIDAVVITKPGMVETKIPELRTKTEIGK